MRLARRYSKIAFSMVEATVVTRLTGIAVCHSVHIFSCRREIHWCQAVQLKSYCKALCFRRGSHKQPTTACPLHGPLTSPLACITGCKTSIQSINSAIIIGVQIYTEVCTCWIFRHVISLYSGSYKVQFFLVEGLVFIDRIDCDSNWNIPRGLWISYVISCLGLREEELQRSYIIDHMDLTYPIPCWYGMNNSTKSSKTVTEWIHDAALMSMRQDVCEEL